MSIKKMELKLEQPSLFQLDTKYQQIMPELLTSQKELQVIKEEINYMLNRNITDSKWHSIWKSFVIKIKKIFNFNGKNNRDIYDTNDTNDTNDINNTNDINDTNDVNNTNMQIKPSIYSNIIESVVNTPIDLEWINDGFELKYDENIHSKTNEPTIQQPYLLNDAVDFWDYSSI